VTHLDQIKSSLKF